MDIDNLDVATLTDEQRSKLFGKLVSFNAKKRWASYTPEQVKKIKLKALKTFANKHK